MLGLHWRIGSLPELAHLPADHRRALLREAFPWSARARVFVRCFFISVIIAGLSMLAADGFGDEQFELVVGLLVLAGMMTLFHLRHVARIRRQIRATLVEELPGERSPVCLECGFDLRAADGEACPECGAPTRLTPERARPSR